MPRPGISCFNCKGSNFAKDCPKHDAQVGCIYADAPSAKDSRDSLSEEDFQPGDYDQDSSSDENGVTLGALIIGVEDDNDWSEIGYAQDQAISGTEALTSRHSSAVQRVNPAEISTRPRSTDKWGKPLLLQTTVNDQPVKVVLDTGAMPSIIAVSRVRSIDSRFKMRRQDTSLTHNTGFGEELQSWTSTVQRLSFPTPMGLSLSLHVDFLIFDHSQVKLPYTALLGEHTMVRWALNIVRKMDLTRAVHAKIGTHR